MGSPRRLRKKVIGPRHPFNLERIEAEMKLAGEYGLRNKKEIWKVQTKLRRYRQRARQMLALDEDVRQREEKILLECFGNSRISPVRNPVEHILHRIQNAVLFPKISKELEFINWEQRSFGDVPPDTPFDRIRGPLHMDDILSQVIKVIALIGHMAFDGLLKSPGTFF